MIDTHAHLDDHAFDADRDAVLAAEPPGGRRRPSSASAPRSPPAGRPSAWRKPAPASMRPSASIRTPRPRPGPTTGGRWLALLDHPRVVALGETGLDRYRDFAPLELQRDYFRRHLRLAHERGLPVVIHCRDAWEDLLPMLARVAAAGPLRGVLHAFSGDAAMAAECVAPGALRQFRRQRHATRTRSSSPCARRRPPRPRDRILHRDRQPLPRARAAPRPPAAERAGPGGPHGGRAGRVAGRCAGDPGRPDRRQRPAAVPHRALSKCPHAEGHRARADESPAVSDSCLHAKAQSRQAAKGARGGKETRGNRFVRQRGE